MFFSFSAVRRDLTLLYIPSMSRPIIYRNYLRHREIILQNAVYCEFNNINNTGASSMNDDVFDGVIYYIR